MPRSSRDNTESQTVSSMATNPKPIRTHSKHLSTELESHVGLIHKMESPTNALFNKTAGKAKELFRSSFKNGNQLSVLSLKANEKKSSNIIPSKSIIAPQGTQEFSSIDASPNPQMSKLYGSNLKVEETSPPEDALSPAGRKSSAPGEPGMFGISNSRNNGNSDQHKQQYLKTKRTQDLYSSARVKTFTVEKHNFSVRDFSPQMQCRTETSNEPRMMEGLGLDRSGEFSVYDRPPSGKKVADLSGSSLNPRASILVQSQEFASRQLVKSPDSSVIHSPSMLGSRLNKSTIDKRNPSRAKVTNSLLEGNTRYFIDRIDELTHENSKLKQEKSQWKSDVEWIKGQLGMAVDPPKVGLHEEDAVKPLKNKIRLLEEIIKDYRSREKLTPSERGIMSVTTVNLRSKYDTGKSATSLVEISPYNSTLPDLSEGQVTTQQRIKQEGEIALLKLRISTLEAENHNLKQSKL